MSKQLPIKDGLFTWPADKPQLLGSRCCDCGEFAFPQQPDCRSCCSQHTEVVELGDHGVLWTWTVQTFMPKTPYASDETAATFKPYGVGYVELPGGLRVESRLKESDAARLSIGMPMELVIEPFRTDEAGNTLMTFCFQHAQRSQ